MTLEIKDDSMVLKNKQFGVKLIKRGLTDPHVLCILLSEDDERWYEKTDFSSYWLDDLISVLHNIQFLLKTSSQFEVEEWGYKWRDRDDNN